MITLRTHDEFEYGSTAPRDGWVGNFLNRISMYVHDAGTPFYMYIIAILQNNE